MNKLIKHLKTICSGISIYPDNATTLDEIIKNQILLCMKLEIEEEVKYSYLKKKI